MTIKYYICDSMFKAFSVWRSTGHEYRIEFKYNSARRQGEYITENTELQELIEKRPEFKKGSIQLANTIVVKEEVAAAKEIKIEHVDVLPKKKEAVPAELNPVTEITTWNEAKDYLRTKGIHHMKLRNPESIREEAKKLGIVFSNL